MEDWEKKNYNARLSRYSGWITFFVIICIILGLVCMYLNQKWQDEKALRLFYEESYEYYYQLYNNCLAK